MSRLIRRDGPGLPVQPEPQILTAPRRTVVITAVVAAVTATVFVLVADHSALSHVQSVDNSWLRLMAGHRDPAITAVAKVFNVIGLVYVTLPVRLAIAGYLAYGRLWWRLAAFASAVLLSEILIGPVKASYDRTRPPGSLVATSGASFPSGHCVAASVTVLAAIIVLVPRGRRRVGWGLAGAAFALLMAVSRSYLAAHWLSDAIAGLLLGTACALVAVAGVDQLQRRWRGRHASGSAVEESAVRSSDRR